jgi:hypothetical protein
MSSNLRKQKIPYAKHKGFKYFVELCFVYQSSSSMNGVAAQVAFRSSINLVI